VKTTPLLYTQDCFRDFIGLPYVEYDCYEIIKLFYAKVLDKDLRQIYTARPNEELTAKMVDEEKSSFIEVQSPIFGDIILFNVFGVPCHVGMYVDEKTFFHTRKNTNCCLEKIANWKKRIVGYYRCP